MHCHSDLPLGQHDYVNHCQKLHAPIKLVLVDKPHDNSGHTPELPSTSQSRLCVSREEANDLFNSYTAKELRFRSVLESRSQLVSWLSCQPLLLALPQASSPVNMPALAQSVVSCVSLLCERLGFIQTPAIVEAVYNLRRACKNATQLEIDTLLSPTVTVSYHLSSYIHDIVNIYNTKPAICIIDD